MQQQVKRRLSNGPRVESGLSVKLSSMLLSSRESDFWYRRFVQQDQQEEVGFYVSKSLESPHQNEASISVKTSAPQHESLLSKLLTVFGTFTNVHSKAGCRYQPGATCRV